MKKKTRMTDNIQLQTTFPYNSFTTVIQVSRLIHAGVNPASADMYIPQEDTTPRIITMSLEEHNAYYPCWSLGRLLQVLPQTVRLEDQVSDAALTLVVYPNNEIRYENGYDDLSFRSDHGLVECAVLALEALNK